MELMRINKIVEKREEKIRELLVMIEIKDKRIKSLEDDFVEKNMKINDIVKENKNWERNYDDEYERRVMVEEEKRVK